MHPLSYLGQHFPSVDLALPYIVQSVFDNTNHQMALKGEDEFRKKYHRARRNRWVRRMTQLEKEYDTIINNKESTENKAKENVRDAECTITSLVSVTIMDLAEVLGREIPPPQDFPAIFVFDEVRAKEFDAICRLDSDCAPFIFYPRTSSFSSRGGYGFFYEAEPKGPVIRIYLNHLTDNHILIEEAMHYLQWYYGTPEFQRTLRPKGYSDDRSKNLMEGRFHFERTGSGLQHALFTPYTDEEMLAKHIEHEACAEVVRCCLGLRSLDYNLVPHKESISGIPSEKDSKQLLEKLTQDGPAACFTQLFSWNTVSSYAELARAYHFSGLVGAFPSDLIHFLGYGLGARIATKIKTEEDLHAFAKGVFKPCSYPLQALDDLVRAYR